MEPCASALLPLHLAAQAPALWPPATSAAGDKPWLDGWRPPLPQQVPIMTYSPGQGQCSFSTCAVSCCPPLVALLLQVLWRPPGHLPGMGMLLLHAVLCQAGKCAFIVSYGLKVLEMIGILTALRLSCFAYQIWWKINTRYRNYFSSCCTTQIAKTPTPTTTTTKTTFFPSQSTAGLNGLSRARTKEKHRGQSWHFQKYN